MNIQYIQKVNYLSMRIDSKSHKRGNGSFVYGCRCANNNKYDNCKVDNYLQPIKYQSAKKRFSCVGKW